MIEKYENDDEKAQEKEGEEEAEENSRKSVRWPAVPVAPMLVHVGVRWLEGQRLFLLFIVYCFYCSLDVSYGAGI